MLLIQRNLLGSIWAKGAAAARPQAGYQVRGHSCATGRSTAK